MKQKALLMICCLLLFPTLSFANTKWFRGHNFEAYVVTSGHSHQSSYPHRNNRHSWGNSGGVLRVSEGQEYSIVVRNPLPVSVAAAVTVDGLNTIDGKRTSAKRGQKWIIAPHSSITLRGWQTGGSTSRRFYFTNEHLSYANWKGGRDGRDYTKNLGVIGVAYFWDSRALKNALYRPHHYGHGHYNKKGYSHSESDSARPESNSRALGKSYRYDDKAGTGMGHKEWNHVSSRHFHYDTGMYSSYDALTIQYKFGSSHRQPKPFEDYEPHYRYKGNYAPEMR